MIKHLQKIMNKDGSKASIEFSDGRKFDMDNKEEMKAAGEKFADILKKDIEMTNIKMPEAKIEDLESISTIQVSVADIVTETIPIIVKRAIAHDAKAGVNIKIELVPPKKPEGCWSLNIRNSISSKGGEVQFGAKFDEKGQLLLF